MQFYKIKDKLVETATDEALQQGEPFVAVMNWAEYQEQVRLLGFEEDMDDLIHFQGLNASRGEVFYDSMMGSFSIPDRKNILGENHKFTFIMDERGVVFTDEEDTAKSLLSRIMISKKWRHPSLERFWFDFMEAIVRDDLAILEKLEREMDVMEDMLFAGETEGIMERVADIRSEISDMKIHYEQLTDLVQEFLENENDYFDEENLHYISLFGARINTLKDILFSLREHTILLREIYKNKLDEKENKLMSLLTVVATIFMPLTLLAGWYGMNFYNMPELTNKWGYPGIIVISILITIIEIIFFKKKRWL